MRKIKIAQIGTSQNSHGNDIWNTIKNLPDIFEIVGYALPENEREKFPNRMPDFEGYNEMAVEEILSNPEIEETSLPKWLATFLRFNRKSLIGEAAAI